MSDNQEIERFIGQSFGGYRVTRFIASGRTGVVFAGVEEASLEQAVAIKLLDPNLTDETFDERFERLALGTSDLSHPNIVEVLDFGFDGSHHFIITRLIEGESLRNRLIAAHTSGTSLTAETIISIAQQVGGALFFAHRSGYIHGDIKPENILVIEDGLVHVSDFGLVRAIGEQRTASSGLSAGTPEYLSPEQARGMTPVTPLADLYSLAIVTYEMTVGRVPFQAYSDAAVIRIQEHEPPPLPSALLPGFPPGIESVLMRPLAKDPASRFASVDAFLGSLRAAMAPAKHGTAPAAGADVVAPEEPSPDAAPDPPLEETSPAASVSVAALASRFAAPWSRRGMLTGGAIATVLVAFLIFSLIGLPNAGSSTRPKTTTVTAESTANPVPSATPPPPPPPSAPEVARTPDRGFYPDQPPFDESGDGPGEPPPYRASRRDRGYRPPDGGQPPGGPPEPPPLPFERQIRQAEQR